MTSSIAVNHGSHAVTRGIRVVVKPQYLPEHSGSKESWRGHRFVFGYLIRITNSGDRRVRLLRRRWEIIDADGERNLVEGDGVVGKQPYLEPGQSFEYSSFCPLPTPWGTMEGEYTMEEDSGELFPVQIARFYLVAPGA